MKYKVKVLEVVSTVLDIEAPDVDAAIAKAESMYAKGELVLELETNAITLVDDKEEK
jgi:hypothetical protein